MTKVTQREAVYQAVVSVLTEAKVHFEDGMDAKSIMTKEFRAQVNTILCFGFTNGDIELKATPSNQAKLADASLLKEYVSGLQSNWLLKDTRLNGNVDHEIKNPGSRTGVADPQVKALRALIKMATSSSEIAELQTYIDKRLAEIHVPTATTVDLSSLPAELQAKYAK